MGFEISGQNYSAGLEAAKVAYDTVKGKTNSTMSAIWAGICGLFGNMSSKLEKMKEKMGGAGGQVIEKNLRNRTAIAASGLSKPLEPQKSSELSGSSKPPEPSPASESSKSSELSESAELQPAVIPVASGYSAEKTEELQGLMNGKNPNIEDITKLIQAGADPAATNANGQTILHFIAEGKNVSSLKKLIQAAENSDRLSELLSTLAKSTENDAPMSNFIGITVANPQGLDTILNAIEKTEQFDVLAKALLDTFQMEALDGKTVGEEFKNPDIKKRLKPQQQKLQTFLAKHSERAELNPIREALGLTESTPTA
jgi:hypothetical protein